MVSLQKFATAIGTTSYPLPSGAPNSNVDRLQSSIFSSVAVTAPSLPAIGTCYHPVWLPSLPNQSLQRT